MPQYANIFSALAADAWAIREADFMGFVSLVERAQAPGAEALLAAAREAGAERSSSRSPVASKKGDEVIALHGVIVNRSASYMSLCGHTSPQAFAEKVMKAADDDSVKRIVLDVDSPGGTVSGTEAASMAVRYARSRKPVVAVANGLMCSAAYWIASQATEIVAGETSIIGSIGALTTHVDATTAYAAAGLKMTVVRSGPEKALGQDFEPLTPEVYAEMQREINEIAAVFYRAVAAGRGISASKVKESYGSGRCWIGRGALEAGLVDRIGSGYFSSPEEEKIDLEGLFSASTTTTTPEASASDEPTPDMSTPETTPLQEATAATTTPEGIGSVGTPSPAPAAAATEAQARTEAPGAASTDAETVAERAAASTEALAASEALASAEAQLTAQAARIAELEAALAPPAFNAAAAVNQLVASGRFSRVQAEAIAPTLTTESLAALVAKVPEGAAPGMSRAAGVHAGERDADGASVSGQGAIAKWRASRA